MTRETQILETDKLSKTFRDVQGGMFSRRVVSVQAVNRVSLSIDSSSTHALVGESGSGKTTFGKTALRIYKPTGGTIKCEGRDITNIGGSTLKELRKDMQMVFQDPTSSLNPRKTVQETVSLPLKVHKDMTRKARKKEVGKLLNTVRLSEKFSHRYPYSLSGGQKQRVGIARALAPDPSLIVLDEPTSALDVSVQAKVLSLLEDLQRQRQLTYLYITHDLGIVRNISDFTSVMYLGRIVEKSETENIFQNPLHPYTKALLSAIPIISEKEKKYKPEEITLEGNIPSPSNVPNYCSFYSRCPERMDRCKEKKPSFMEVEKGHFVHCFLYS